MYLLVLNGVYDNGFEWSAGISTTEYNSVYESSPLQQQFMIGLLVLIEAILET